MLLRSRASDERMLLFAFATGGRAAEHSGMANKDVAIAIAVLIVVHNSTLGCVQLHSLSLRNKVMDHSAWRVEHTGVHVLVRTRLSRATVRLDHKKNPPPMAQTMTVMNRAYCMLMALL